MVNVTPEEWLKNVLLYGHEVTEFLQGENILDNNLDWSNKQLILYKNREKIITTLQEAKLLKEEEEPQAVKVWIEPKANRIVLITIENAGSEKVQYYTLDQITKVALEIQALDGAKYQFRPFLGEAFGIVATRRD